MALNSEQSIGGLTSPAFAIAKPQELNKGASEREAWNREMERAQLEAWLSHDAIGGKAASSLSGRSASLNLPTAMRAEIAPAEEQPGSPVTARPIEQSPLAARIASGRSQIAPGHARAAEVPRRSIDERTASEHPAAALVKPEADSNSKLQALAHTRALVRTAELAAVLGNDGIVKSSFTVRGPVESGVTLGAREQSEASGAVPDPTGAISAVPVQTTQPLASLITIVMPSSATALPQAMSTDAVSSSQSKVAASTIEFGRPGSFTVARKPTGDDAELGEPTDSTTPNAARVPTPPTEPAAEAREPIRLHAEWAPGGVSLWLGLDAHVLNQAPLMLAQLQRWLAIQGIPLLHASCNGKPIVEGEPLAHGETNNGRGRHGPTQSNDSPQEHS